MTEFCPCVIIHAKNMPVCPPVSFRPGGFLINKENFKSHQELISILRIRGVEIKTGSDEDRIIHVFKTENYYYVINGYKELFIKDPATHTSDEKYKEGINFDEIYSLYLFDRELRHIYLKFLLILENNFKTVVAHTFSEKYGYDNYLKLENFNSTPSKDTKTLKRIATGNRLDIINDAVEIDL